MEKTRHDPQTGRKLSVTVTFWMDLQNRAAFRTETVKAELRHERSLRGLAKQTFGEGRLV